MGNASVLVLVVLMPRRFIPTSMGNASTKNGAMHVNGSSPRAWGTRNASNRVHTTDTVHPHEHGERIPPVIPGCEIVTVHPHEHGERGLERLICVSDTVHPHEHGNPPRQNSCRLKFLNKIKFEIRNENLYKAFRRL